MFLALLSIYVLSAVVNLVMCAWSYFDSDKDPDSTDALMVLCPVLNTIVMLSIIVLGILLAFKERGAKKWWLKNMW